MGIFILVCGLARYRRAWTPGQTGHIYIKLEVEVSCARAGSGIFKRLEHLCDPS